MALLGMTALSAVAAPEEPPNPRWIKVSTRESGQGPVLHVVLKDGTKRELPVTSHRESSMD